MVDLTRFPSTLVLFLAAAVFSSVALADPICKEVQVNHPRDWIKGILTSNDLSATHATFSYQWKDNTYASAQYAGATGWHLSATDGATNYKIEFKIKNPDGSQTLRAWSVGDTHQCEGLENTELATVFNPSNLNGINVWYTPA